MANIGRPIKSLIILLSVVLIGLANSRPVCAEKIDDLQVSAMLGVDGTLVVTEIISYDFEGAKTAQTNLYLPTKYSHEDKLFNVKIGSLSVTDNGGNQLKFKTETSEDSLKITVNNDNKFFSNLSSFRLIYSVDGAVQFGYQEDVFYWNVTSNSWPIKIKNSSVKIILPRKVVVDTAVLNCFYGPPNTRLNCRSKEGDDRLGQASFVFENPFEIFPGESNSVYFTLPKGLIHEPNIFEIVKNFINNNLLIFLPILILIIFSVLWRHHGRDPRGGGESELQVSPPMDLSPAEIGVIMDEKVNSQDIISEIIYLAVRGYFKITRVFNGVHDDYVFTKLQDIRYTESEHQQSILLSFFEGANQVSLTELGKSFSDNLKNINHYIYQSTVEKGYFSKNPAKVRAFYLIISMAVMIAGTWYTIISAENSWLGIGGSIISGVLIIFFGFAMPRRTKKGVDCREKILGFKYFLIGGHNDANINIIPKNQSQFEAYLPFSMVLEVDKDWSYQYKNSQLTAPVWFEDQTIAQNYNALLLVDSLTSFQQSCYDYLFK